MEVRMERRGEGEEQCENGKRKMVGGKVAKE